MTIYKEMPLDKMSLDQLLFKANGYRLRALHWQFDRASMSMNTEKRAEHLAKVDQIYTLNAVWYLNNYTKLGFKQSDYLDDLRGEIEKRYTALNLTKFGMMDQAPMDTQEPVTPTPPIAESVAEEVETVLLNPSDKFESPTLVGFQSITSSVCKPKRMKVELMRECYRTHHCRTVSTAIRYIIQSGQAKTEEEIRQKVLGQS